MTIYHVHHIVPKHMGGTDDPSNLIKLTVEEHAEAHRKLYEQYGHWQDKLAWDGLSGQITKPEALSIASSKANKGKPKTPEQRAKMSETHRRHHAVNPNLRHTLIAELTRKKVMIDGITFNSQTEAAKHYGVSGATITNWIYKGKAYRM